MKKVLSKILKFIGKIFKAIYAIVDAAIVTPLSKLVYFINDKITTKGGGFDKFINNPNTPAIIYIFNIFLVFKTFIIKLVIIAKINIGIEIIILSLPFCNILIIRLYGKKQSRIDKL